MITMLQGWLAETCSAEEPNVIRSLWKWEWHQNWKGGWVWGCVCGVKQGGGGRGSCAGLRNKLQYDYSD